MPSSFPLVGMGIACLIGITVIGFILNPSSPKNSEPNAKAPYTASSSPSQEGTETSRVTPTPKTSTTASKPTGSATKPVTRKPEPTKVSPSPKPSTSPKPTVKPTETQTPDPTVYTFIVRDEIKDICTAKGPGTHVGTGVKYYSLKNNQVPGDAYDHEAVDIPEWSVACPIIEPPSLPIDPLNVLS